MPAICPPMPSPGSLPEMISLMSSTSTGPCSGSSLTGSGANPSSVCEWRGVMPTSPSWPRAWAGTRERRRRAIVSTTGAIPRYLSSDSIEYPYSVVHYYPSKIHILFGESRSFPNMWPDIPYVALNSMFPPIRPKFAANAYHRPSVSIRGETVNGDPYQNRAGRLRTGGRY